MTVIDTMRAWPVSFLLSGAAGLALACGGTQRPTCPTGNALLDGVCVSQQVANYVSCVRAQGAQLGSEKSEKLSSEVGFAGVKAAGARDVKESLERRYSTSDANVNAIIQTCNRIAGLPDTSLEKHTAAAPATDCAPGLKRDASGQCMAKSEPPSGSGHPTLSWREVSVPTYDLPTDGIDGGQVIGWGTQWICRAVGNDGRRYPGKLFRHTDAVVCAYGWKGGERLANVYEVAQRPEKGAPLWQGSTIAKPLPAAAVVGSENDDGTQYICRIQQVSGHLNSHPGRLVWNAGKSGFQCSVGNGGNEDIQDNYEVLVAQ